MPTIFIQIYFKSMQLNNELYYQTVLLALVNASSMFRLI